MRHRHELTDAQWTRIEPLLPSKVGDPGRSAVDNRRFVIAVLYVLRTGIPGPISPSDSASPTPCGNATTAGARPACGNAWAGRWAGRA
jgi:transposase